MTRGRIFINYRREDSRADSGRLYDRLVARFPGRVFRDVASLEPGVEWPVAIARVLGQAEACIVVIGKQWLNIRDAVGNRRLDDPNDTVRQEIVTALQRQTRIFPVLVGNAQMPPEQDLPEDLRPLCRRNALEITEQDWDGCYHQLLRALEVALGERIEKSPRGPTSRSKAKWLAIGAACLCAVIALGVYGAKKNQGPANGAASNGQFGSPPPADSESRQPIESLQPAGHGNGATATHDASAQDETPPLRTPSDRQVNPAELTGNWHALVNTGGEQLDETVELYRDHSFRVLFSGMAGAVGKWQYSAGHDSLELVDGTNFAKDGLKFTCSFHLDTSPDEFSGPCQDRMRSSWTASLTRASGGPAEPPSEVPRVDVSVLTLAERAAFTQLLATQRCTCTCGMTVLICLQKDRTCPYSPGLAANALALFLRMTRA
jgi:hypothetical protein